MLCRKEKRASLPQLKNMRLYCTGQSERLRSEQVPRSPEAALGGHGSCCSSAEPRFPPKARMIFYIQCREGLNVELSEFLHCVVGLLLVLLKTDRWE